ncbi:hypothetical protein V494_04413 [Pseudogymnoascus sp. VKM F-4513 (FW-928)]|nr:hypothetical protein V494_04413 [Pseudogymnoascus sp. VKM F-4513 (FW-928)]
MDDLPLDPNSAISEFKAVLAKCTKKAACGRKYVLVKRLKLWIESKVGLGLDDRTQASRLLDFAYRTRSRNRPAPAITRGVLCHRENGCLLVFCILLKLDRGHLIDEFRKHNICDKHLPINLHLLLEKTRAIAVRSPDSLSNEFNKLQWRFCPATFEMGLGKKLVPEHILPFCEKKLINTKGGTAQLWQVDVPAEFVGADIVRAISKHAVHDEKTDDIGLRYKFALKTFAKGNERLFENEREAFRALHKHAGMVRYLDDYEHHETYSQAGTTKTITTSNIILEFGEHDLEEYLLEFDPPIFQSEIISFWECLFDIADAVEGIHHLKVVTDGQTNEFYGWHADIKPDNILIVKGHFKLADPGFATFVEKTETEPKKIVTGGTETYGAPERRYSRSGEKEVEVSPTIDIWSLGCVFSIAATWVVLGRQGMLQFTKLRERAILKIIGEKPEHPTGAHLREDCFHNGEEVLPDVLSWHACLRSVLRKSDIVTSSVLDLIDNEMLVGNAGCRIKASDLCKRLNEIRSRMQAEAPALPTPVMEALLAINDAPPRQSTAKTTQKPTKPGKSSTIADQRQAQKSALLSAPLKMTARRSEYLKSELGSSNVNSQRDEGRPELSLDVRSFQTLANQNSFEIPSLPIQDNPRVQIENMAGLEVVGTPIDPRLVVGNHVSTTRQRPASRRQRTNSPQDVFQARQEIKSRPKKGIVFRKTTKDELLSGHFSNRDIEFLIDNAESMDQYWYNARYLLKTLLLKATGQDENGMDLSFTSGNVSVRGSNDLAKFMKAMDDSKPQPRLHIHTDMRRSLGDIFHKYYQGATRRDAKNLTVIVFTDGMWDGMEDKDEVGNLIIAFAKKLQKTVGDLKARPVSIEFVQFGKALEAANRLRRLDDDLVVSGIPDIVDSEHCSGDVNKMLLGSFVEEYDRIDDDEPVYMSPTTESGAGLLTDSPYSQPSGYFPNASNAEANPFQSPTRSSMPRVRRETWMGGIPREDPTRPTAALQREQPSPSTRLSFHPR